MKTRRFLFVVLILVSLWVTQTSAREEYTEVATFRGASLSDEVINPLKAASINDMNSSVLIVGDNTYQGMDVRSSDNLMQLVSKKLLSDILGASIHISLDDKIILKYSDKEIIFEDESNVANFLERDVEIAAAPSYFNGQLYLPIGDICTMLDIPYAYSISNNEGRISSEIEKGTLPASYDMRSDGRAPRIVDQGNTKTCWSYASLAALSSSLLPTQNISFDANDMISDEVFSVDEEIGGTYTMALAYLTGWRGPKVEDDAEGDSTYHLHEARIFGHDDREEIKRAVYQYSGVSTSIYASLGVSNLSDFGSYNAMTNAYYYYGDQSPNHDVVIIGWDDNYSASNFRRRPEGDGAFICQNSWGEDFGDKGVFYVSYYDVNIGSQAVSYSMVDTYGIYSDIYQYDLCGYVGNVGYNKSSLYAANVYTAKSDAKLSAAGFYSLGKGTTYEIYVVADYTNTESLLGGIKVSSGKVDGAGFYTAKFTEDVEIHSGSDFAIVIMIDTPGSGKPMAVEYIADEYSANVDISDGRGYISSDGYGWESIEEKMNVNLCLKAYTK